MGMASEAEPESLRSQQTSVADFTGGFPLGDGHALKITFTGGALIVYGATVDNVTNDPSAQFLSYRVPIS